MSQITRQEVLAKQRDRYARAGKEHKTKIISELVELFGCHRNPGPRFPRRLSWASPRIKLLPPLRALWLHALQSCGLRRRHQIPLRTDWNWTQAQTSQWPSRWPIQRERLQPTGR